MSKLPGFNLRCPHCGADQHESMVHDLGMADIDPMIYAPTRCWSCRAEYTIALHARPEVHVFRSDREAAKWERKMRARNERRKG